MGGLQGEVGKVEYVDPTSLCKHDINDVDIYPMLLDVDRVGHWCFNHDSMVK